MDKAIGIFVNFTNHPSSNWSEEQKSAVREKYNSEIVDVPFPPVSASADESEIKEQASKCVEQICGYAPAAVMCQGEFGLTYQVVNMLKERGVCVVYSCSERRTVEKKTDSGTVKTSEFSFVRFRGY